MSVIRRTIKQLVCAKVLLLTVLSPTLMRAQAVPSLTPNSNPYDRLATAIAKAEGFYTQGTIPSRFHNPGDLKSIRGQKYFGQVRVGKGGHIIFRTDAAGWYALREQLRKMVEGESRFYNLDMSIAQIAKKYAGNYKVWAKNVSKNLGVPSSITLRELFEIPPVYSVQWECA